MAKKDDKRSVMRVVYHNGELMVGENDSEEIYIRKTSRDQYESLKRMAQTEVPVFANSFTDYLETFYEIVKFTTHQILQLENSDLSESQKLKNPVYKAFKERGRGGLYLLAEEWTNEFEKLNKDRQWDGEFHEEVEAFFVEKLSE